MVDNRIVADSDRVFPIRNATCLRLARPGVMDGVVFRGLGSDLEDTSLEFGHDDLFVKSLDIRITLNGLAWCNEDCVFRINVQDRGELA